LKLTSDKLIQFDLFNPRPQDILELLNLRNTISSLHSLIVELPAFPNVPDVILRNELAKAVGSTTAIEGNTLNQEEILTAFDKADKKFTLQKLEQEVQNSREVYEFIINNVASNNIYEMSVPLLRQIHNLTTKELPYIANKPGKFRNGQVEFGYPKMPSLFPDEASVETAVSAFVSWCNKKSSQIEDDPVIKALLAHYYLTEIHPFFDGNGRTSRAIEAFWLLSKKILHPHFFYILANYWVRNKNLYLDVLREIRQSSNAFNFVKMGMQGLIEELTFIKERMKIKISKLMFIDYVHFLHREKRKAPHKLTDRMVQVLELLSDTGRISYSRFISSTQINTLYRKISKSTRSRDFQKLRENNLIKLIETEDVMYIETNLDILQGLQYKI
jgi:Fic family protein